ncbi:peptidylprolyl isomerase [Bacillus sp. SG-1]|uniref:peptidylprolyl isomerase n=1 Tax=Bacillus sp. SG-1 TaxID=161544 RepID=UPI00015455FC|nr:peptidylprolyl isomerase [Bacillus sp. SG-1]EDL63478.1 post-translocation molecular chaperone [Bacillus sp. SG-1]
MKKWILTMSLAAGVITLSACNNAEDNGGNSEVVAETKAGDVTKEELYTSMKEKFTPQMEQALQELVLKKVLGDKYEVTEEEVDEKLNEAKDQLGPQFDMFLSQYNLNEESFREYLELQLLQEKAATADIEVSEDELQEYYDNWKPEIEVRHILVDDEETAKEVKQKLADGAKFEDLAKEYSNDPGSAENGGSLGWVDYEGRQNFVPEFSEALEKLKTGKVSEPVKTQYGFHIIEVTDKKEKNSFDEMKDELEKSLKLSKVTPEKIQQAMKEIVEDAGLEIKDEDLENSFEQILNPPETPAVPEEGETPAPSEDETDESAETTEE